MRKSTTITIGLLAVSIASCKHKPVHHHPVIPNNFDDEYYVNDGYGYSPMMYYYPIWVDNYYGLDFGFVGNHTSVVYRTRNGAYAATSGGRVAHVSPSAHGAIGHSSTTSRGGFGGIGHGGGHGGGHAGS